MTNVLSNEDKERLHNLNWFGEMKILLLPTGLSSNDVNDISEKIYQINKKYWKCYDNK